MSAASRVVGRMPLTMAPFDGTPVRLVFRDERMGEWVSPSNYSWAGRSWRSTASGIPVPSTATITGWMPAEPEDHDHHHEDR